MKKKILIVDDQQVNRQILCKILGDDYELYTAENGAVAMEILNREKEAIVAILLDIVMPVMDGYQVLDYLHRDALLSQIPVIVTTQEESEEAEIKALSLGAHDFLTKPYKPMIIRHRLANTIKLRETSAIVYEMKKDELTDLYSKAFFYKKAQQLLQKNSEAGYDIICCDIEKFKLVNDIFGVSVGDELLKYCAELIKRYVGNQGICSRFDADTFMVLLPHQERYSSQYFENAIRELNEFPITINLVMRWGIYYVENKALPINAMCDRAKLAGQSIKGKYDVYYALYDDAMRQKLLNEQAITDCMKSALEEKQFEVYFQPKYELVTEKIAGAEALIRWIHPEKGLMSPADFIPLFEKNGFITNLDLYVWDSVCKTIRGWIDSGSKVTPISVNVSRVDIYNPHLPEMILGIVNQYGLSPENLHLEITETAYTENPKQIIEAAGRLKEYGFVIEMDDFGTGYSSLNMLSELPIDVLKLDMKFIQNESAKNNSKNILSFIVSLAKWLDLLVVAEGVETEAQIQMLRNMDCNYVQGYYYAKPMGQRDFEKLLRNSEVEPITNREKMTQQNLKTVVTQVGSTGKTMMIVDDIRLNRAVLAEIFKGQYTIVEAENGMVALEYLCTHKTEVSIILLDLIMPVMDGFQVMEKLKKDPSLDMIPVVITSQAGEASEAKALAMGAADFISKPYNAEVAIRRVQNVMAGAEMKLLKVKKNA